MFREAGTKPEYECYDVGHLFNLAYMLDQKLYEPPLFLQFVLGIPGALPANRDVLEFATGPGFFKVELDRAIALVDDAVDVKEIDDALSDLAARGERRDPHRRGRLAALFLRPSASGDRNGGGAGARRFRAPGRASTRSG